MNKKGVIENLQAIVVPLVGLCLVLVVSFLILSKVRTQAIAQEGTGQYSMNATDATTNAIKDIPGWLPIIVITIIGAVLLGLVAMFGGRRQ